MLIIIIFLILINFILIYYYLLKIANGNILTVLNNKYLAQLILF